MINAFNGTTEFTRKTCNKCGKLTVESFDNGTDVCSSCTWNQKEEVFECDK